MNNIIFIVGLATLTFYHLINGAPKPSTAIDYDYEETPKIKEVAEGPYYDQFDYNVTRNYTAIAGTPAELLCRVKLKPTDGNKTISWLRHRDLHLLTLGTHTYSRDNRFSAVHRFPGSDWVLRIQQTQINDTGIYQCQVGVTPPAGMTFHLSVVEPITSIIGAPDIYINKGSNLNITCIIKNWPIMDNPQNPSENQQVIWTHGKKGINYDSPRGGVSVVTEKSNKYSSSSLLIIHASKEDSGKYTCKPDLANQTSVFVHVLPGETPAAMKNDAKTKGASDTTSIPEIGKELSNASAFTISILLLLLVTLGNAALL